MNLQDDGDISMQDFAALLVLAQQHGLLWPTLLTLGTSLYLIKQNVYRVDVGM